MGLAPILLFVYNRPDHIRRTVEALQRNSLAEYSDLYVFSDGPRSLADMKNVLQVRDFIKHIKGFKNITLIERERNYGLACSIISGVTEVMNRFGYVVVLEDDIITAPYFLKYMNEALAKYYDNEKVMHIAGYMLPIDSLGLNETFFYRNTTCWGWGTWKRAWDLMEEDACSLMARFSEETKYHFNIDGVYDSWKMLELQRKGEINSWAIRWYASVFLAGGLCLHPSKSLTSNIGNDATGVHCRNSSIYDVELYLRPIIQYVETITEDRTALERIREFFKRNNRSSIRKVVTRLFRL